ncbi:laccase-4 [Aplysia californica]|uniref:Laccase-4 n=1 Tax=Aplysia californica TaxID=6500 RepID=A0ABM1A4F6_APLCA|nr:laccase-4 [Aplysia californica]
MRQWSVCNARLKDTEPSSTQHEDHRTPRKTSNFPGSIQYHSFQIVYHQLITDNKRGHNTQEQASVIMKTSFVLLFCWTVAMTARPVTSACQMTDDVCEFWLEIEHKMTMMSNKVAVFPENGQLYSYDVRNTSEATPMSEDGVVIADGWETQRLVVVANGSMPGPPIEVWENQTVIVHVHNRMTSSSVTVHWHGLHQHGTPWMDGVAFITQCPISPQQKFTYKFKASPRGTFWYHSHIGAQLSMGLIGALIIRPKEPLKMEEHILMLQDWNHDIDADLMHMRMVYGNYENRTKLKSTGSLEGAHFSMFPFDAGLINGRGRFYFEDGSNTGAPLTRFSVKKGNSYRFRIIGSGSLYPFRVSIDNHPLTIVASDGFELEPMVVESIILNPGERYDVILHAIEDAKPYWIRAETLEIDVPNHKAEAILEYEGSPSLEEPTTSRKVCSQADSCIVANCPFSYFPEDHFTTCKSVSDFRAKVDNFPPGTDESEPEDIEEIFLNFAFPGTTWTPGSVNGRAFEHLPVSGLTQPQDITTWCDPALCGEQQVCSCPNALNLQHNKVYQLVLLNMGVGKGWAHPVHMHGHTFHLLKTGYPKYNETTGKLIDDNHDIDCRGNVTADKSFCNSAAWANSSWGGNNIPGLELEFPPRKDTVQVPTGGYVVIRIRADNPGLWFMHCHIELHAIDGMAIMLNESFPQVSPPPKGFPKCGNFAPDMEDDIDDEPVSEPEIKEKPLPDSEDNYDKNLFWTVVGILIAVILIQFFILAFCLCRNRNNAHSGKDANVYSNGAFNAKDVPS